MAHSTNYRSTLILPSPDSRAEAALAPAKPGTIAALQFAMLSNAAYARTSDDILSAIAADRAKVPLADRPAFHTAFFSRGQPCLRTSPLVKSHGWAIHHDAEGRIALVDPASGRFAELLADEGVTKIAGMRSSRR